MLYYNINNQNIKPTESSDCPKGPGQSVLSFGLFKMHSNAYSSMPNKYPLPLLQPSSRSVLEPKQKNIFGPNR